MTPNDALPSPAAATKRLDRICIAGFHLLLLAVYFVPRNNGAKLMIAALAVMAATDLAALRRPLPPPFLIVFALLGAIAVWTGLGMAFHGAGAAAIGEVLTNFALLALVLLAARRLLACWDLRRICLSLVIVAGASAAASIALHLWSGLPWQERLIPLGRSANSIPGAGGLAIAVVAAALLLRDPGGIGRGARLAAAATAALLLGAIVQTQSRGPLIALVLALLVMLPGLRLGPARLFAAAIAAWCVTTGLVLLDPLLRSYFCTTAINLCRPSYRGQIWTWVVENVARRPLTGLGPSYRFDDPTFNHPHNGLLGLAMFYGLPVLAMSLAALFAYCRHVSGRTAETALFCSGALVLALGYMGTDLSNPFAFANTHYLFLWLPVGLALAARARG